MARIDEERNREGTLLFERVHNGDGTGIERTYDESGNLISEVEVDGLPIDSEPRDVQELITDVERAINELKIALGGE